MKNLLTKMAVVLTIVLSMTGLALAGSTATVTVSCSIPLMPGLNTPLLEAETVKTQEETSVEQKTQEPKQTKQENETLMSQESVREEKAAEVGKTAMTVKTYYSR